MKLTIGNVRLLYLLGCVVFWVVVGISIYLLRGFWG